jgi:hypothetical protein
MNQQTQVFSPEQETAIKEMLNEIIVKALTPVAERIDEFDKLQQKVGKFDELQATLMSLARPKSYDELCLAAEEQKIRASLLDLQEKHERIKLRNTMNAARADMLSFQALGTKQIITEIQDVMTAAREGRQHAVSDERLMSLLALSERLTGGKVGTITAVSSDNKLAQHGTSALVLGGLAALLVFLTGGIGAPILLAGLAGGGVGATLSVAASSIDNSVAPGYRLFAGA